MLVGICMLYVSAAEPCAVAARSYIARSDVSSRRYIIILGIPTLLESTRVFDS